MRSITVLSLFLALLCLGKAVPTVIDMSYCGFGGSYCGESFNDDVYSRSNTVLLAYAIISTNGALVVDADNYPKTQVQNWRNTGKRVMLSIGGPNNNWTNAFDT